MKTLPIILFIWMCGFVQTGFGETYNILDYGALPDGVTMNTEAIQKSIDQASAQGGGTVVFPPGKFLSGSLQLKSNVELYFEKDAVLLGSTNPFDYNKLDGNSSALGPQADDNSSLGLIQAIEVSHIKMSGEGTINGQGLALALMSDSLHHAGVLVDHHYNARRMRPSELVRPKLFRFLRSDHIEINDLTLTNSAAWGLSFELCENLILDHLSVVNRAYWNNDGIDITDCKNVKIINCHINAADDGICLKSYYPGACNDSIYISNCVVRSSASAMKMGTASFGGFKNITIDNIQVFDTFRSAIAIESVDGAIIENIRVTNVVAKNTGNAIFIRLGHRSGDKPGIVRNIQIKDMWVEVPFGRPDMDYDLRGPEVDFFHNPFPSAIAGIPGHRVDNVSIENLTIVYPGRASRGMAYIPVSDLDRVPEHVDKYPEFSMFGELPAWGFYIRHVDGVAFKNSCLRLEDNDFRPAFVLDDVANLSIENTTIENAGPQAQFVLRNVVNYQIEGPVQNITVVK